MIRDDQLDPLVDGTPRWREWGHTRDGERHRPAHVTVVVVEDHHLVREGLRLVLGSTAWIDVVGEAGTAAELWSVLERVQPDVMLLDLTLPDGDGVEIARRVATRYPLIRIVVLTMHRDAETVRQALTAGAAGYVVKGAYSGELFDAIASVAEGKRYLHSNVVDAVVGDPARIVAAGNPLTLREREVLSMLASGQRAAAIADALSISPFTVRRHIANAGSKLGVRGIPALILYAVRHGIGRNAE